MLGYSLWLLFESSCRTIQHLKGIEPSALLLATAMQTSILLLRQLVRAVWLQIFALWHVNVADNEAMWSRSLKLGEFRSEKSIHLLLLLNYLAQPLGSPVCINSLGM